MHVVRAQVSAHIMMTPLLRGIEHTQADNSNQAEQTSRQGLGGQRGKAQSSHWRPEVHTATTSVSHLLETQLTMQPGEQRGTDCF